MVLKAQREEGLELLQGISRVPLWLGWLVAAIGWPLRCLLNYWQQGEPPVSARNHFPADVGLVFEGDAAAVMAFLDGVL